MNIDGHTKMYCLIGSPVGHSGSPAMYNYSFDRLGINSAYLAYDVPLEKTGEAVAALRLLGCGGFNVTMPCKTEVTKYLDRLSPACELIGASNCVVVECGEGYAFYQVDKGLVLVQTGMDSGEVLHRLVSDEADAQNIYDAFVE